MVKVLGIFGSPRKDGNTDILLRSALDGCIETGAEVISLHLCDLRFSGCSECGRCDTNGICPVEDDLVEVYDTIEEADAMILASPLFFDNVSGQIKCLMDRCQCIWVRRAGLNIDTKGIRPAAFISTGARINSDFICAKHTAKIFFISIGMKMDMALCYGGFEEKGSIVDHPTALHDSHELGKHIGTAAKTVMSRKDEH